MKNYLVSFTTHLVPIMIPHILIIDDDPILTQIIARNLQPHGFTTQIETNSLRGLEIALENPPDLLLLDLVMPSMDGWEVLQRLQAVIDIPILLMTASEDVQIPDTVKLSSDCLVTKPIAPKLLLSKTREILDL